MSLCEARPGFFPLIICSAQSLTRLGVFCARCRALCRMQGHTNDRDKQYGGNLVAKLAVCMPSAHVASASGCGMHVAAVRLARAAILACH
jgi:hypothetical protein